MHCKILSSISEKTEIKVQCAVSLSKIYMICSKATIFVQNKFQVTMICVKPYSL